MAETTAMERILRRDRAVVLAGLGTVAALAWLYILAGAGMDMNAMPAARAGWSAAWFGLMFAMWAVMMAAMMLPGAAPMILLFATIGRRMRERGSPHVPTGIFALGYAVVWTGFSLGATLLHWGLDRAALLSPMMASADGLFGGLLLLAAGLYQLSPLKQACLRRCRAPMDFVMHRWRAGPGGALRMGLTHGLYCVGCCWMLMTLLFVGGVMNLLWIAAITSVVLIEKLVPAGHALGRAAGLGLIGWGAVLIGRALSVL